MLEIVKAMVDEGTALITMGNHEFNAIAYATRDPRVDGHFLRPHTKKNTNQHRAFVDQLTGLQQAEFIQWFRTFPLWLDLGGLRVVHACWHADSIKVVERELGSNVFVSDYQLARASSKGDPLYEAVEILLKGPEIAVEPPYLDKDGHRRDKARLRWWNDGATTLDEIAEISSTFEGLDHEPYPALPPTPVPVVERS